MSMRAQIKATEMALTPAIKDYAEKKVLSLEKFFKGSGEVLAQIEVGKTTRHHKSGNVFRAEISIRADGQNYYAVSEKDDLYAAIDEVKDEMAHEIVSSKSKKETLFRRGGAKIKAMLKRLTFRKNI